MVLEKVRPWAVSTSGDAGRGHGKATAVVQRHEDKRWWAAGLERGASGSCTRTRDRGS